MFIKIRHCIFICTFIIPKGRRIKISMYRKGTLRELKILIRVEKGQNETDANTGIWSESLHLVNEAKGDRKAYIL